MRDHRQRGLADAAPARTDRNDVLHAFDRLPGAVATDRMADLGAHVHVDSRDAGQLHHRRTRLIAHLIFHGHAGVVSSIVNDTTSPLTDRSLMNPRTHDVAMQIGILHNLERLPQDVCVFECHGSNGIGFGWPGTRNGRLGEWPKARPTARPPARAGLHVAAGDRSVDLLAKDDADVQWHAKHGLVLMGAEIVAFLALAVIMQVLLVATFGVMFLVSLVFVFLWAAVLAVHVFAIVRALNGYRLIIPGVSAYASRF